MIFLAAPFEQGGSCAVAISMVDCDGTTLAYPGPISGESFEAVYLHHGDGAGC